MSFLDDVGGLIDKGVGIYGNISNIEKAREETGVRSIVAQTELAKQQARGDEAALNTAAILSRNESLKKIALYLSIAVSAVTIGSWAFKRKKR